MGDIVSNLVLYWKFDNNTNDSSPQGNNGSPTGSPTYQTGQVSQCLSFDGSTQYVHLASATAFPASSSAFSMAAWVKASTLDATDRVFFMFGAEATNQGPHLTLSSSRFRYAIWGDGTLNYTSAPGTTNWYHVVATFDGTNGRLYVDNVLRTGPTAQTYTKSGTVPVRVGGATAGANFRACLVDEVRVYTRTLGTDDIADLYNFTGASSTASSRYYRMVGS